MGLMKLLQQPKREVSETSDVSLKTKGKSFFLALENQLIKDLSFLQAQKNFEKEIFFKMLKISSGELFSNDTKELKSYIFIHIPNTAGFLIEPNDQFNTLSMYRATKVYQQLNNASESSAITPFFVLKSDSIEEFKLLDENYVRVKDNNKTLSALQLSETLLLLAHSMK